MFKINSIAYEQGKRAYHKGWEVYQNPYSDDQERDQYSWEKGWSEASNEEEDFSDRYSLNAD